MKIETNNVEHLDDFIRLNEEWISKYFEIEETDRNLAANPQRIIDEGGYLFAIVVNDRVVAVCALFKDSEDIFELARMAVSPSEQGKGYGDVLMKTCIDKLKEIEAQKVYLVSNTILIPAITMYRKHGFKTVSNGQHPIYSRANIVMERKIG